MVVHMIPTRRFGRTGIAMPVLSCGGMRFQQSWDDLPANAITADSQANLEATVRRALEMGINHIETARGYGTSEMQLGRLLPSLPRESLIVQTKIAPTAEPREFLDNFDRSMANLRLGHVDLLAIHGINNRELLDWTLRPGGCLEAAQGLRRDGRCRFIGFSTHAPLPIIREAIGTGAFDYVNLHWYWIQQRHWPAVEDATRHDMGVFIISPSDKGGRLYEPPEKLRQLCAPLEPMAFNDLFCLARPEVHTLSVGAACPSDFDAHVAAIADLDRADELSAPIAARLQDAMVGYHGAEWMARWEEGIPDWSAIPGNINVHEIIRLWNHATALDMLEFAKARYNLLGNAGHWFPGHNAADLDTHDLRPFLAGHPFPDRLLGALQDARRLLHGDARQRLGKSD
jgi:predicted aldo/keto reductase-like oxidoreductase